MNPPSAVVVGMGNRYRRDDALGPVVIDLLAGRTPPRVQLVACEADPTLLLECWSSVELTVVVDAVRCRPSTPGLIHRTDLGGRDRPSAAPSTHGLCVLDALALGRKLDQAPERLISYLVEVADTGFGLELTPAVREALPCVVQAVLTELAVPSHTPCSSAQPVAVSARPARSAAAASAPC